VTYRQVMLIRCPPDAAVAHEVREQVMRWSESGCASLLFFHSGGVEWARATSASTAQRWRASGLDLMVCSAAWRRRYPEPPPPAWQPGSLVQFWDAVDGAEQVASFGALDRA